MLVDTRVACFQPRLDGSSALQDNSNIAAWQSQHWYNARNMLPHQHTLRCIQVDEFESGSAMHHTTHPVCIMMHRNGGAYYSFPQFGSQKGIKIGRMFHLNESTDPDAVRRDIDDRDVAILRVAVADWFPAANGRVLKSSTCMFTNTPDLDFLIDKHPRFPQVRNTLFEVPLDSFQLTLYRWG
jgi:glycine/D-amino acid oxidase-like deaminating enzyme